MFVFIYSVKIDYVCNCAILFRFMVNDFVRNSIDFYVRKVGGLAYILPLLSSIRPNGLVELRSGSIWQYD